VLAFCCCDELLETINLKGWKGLFWVMVSEISVHGHFALLLWACGGQYILGGVCRGRGFYLIVAITSLIHYLLVSKSLTRLWGSFQVQTSGEVAPKGDFSISRT
jgi:hypothetical protein